MANGSSNDKLVRICNRSDTADNWSTNNPILKDGEIGYDSTNNILKVGNGSSNWNNLKSISGNAVSTDSYDDTEIKNQIMELNTYVDNEIKNLNIANFKNLYPNAEKYIIDMTLESDNTDGNFVVTQLSYMNKVLPDDTVDFSEILSLDTYDCFDNVSKYNTCYIYIPEISNDIIKYKYKYSGILSSGVFEKVYNIEVDGVSYGKIYHLQSEADATSDLIYICQSEDISLIGKSIYIAANPEDNVTTINKLYDSKANKSDVYTKSETDELISSIDTVDTSDIYEKISNEEANRKNQDSVLLTKINDLDNKLFKFENTDAIKVMIDIDFESFDLIEEITEETDIYDINYTTQIGYYHGGTNYDAYITTGFNRGATKVFVLGTYQNLFVDTDGDTYTSDYSVIINDPNSGTVILDSDSDTRHVAVVKNSSGITIGSFRWIYTSTAGIQCVTLVYCNDADYEFDEYGTLKWYNYIYPINTDIAICYKNKTLDQ